MKTLALLISCRMPPDVNRNEPEPRPERIFPHMPRMMDPPSPPRQQPARNRNGNRDRNQAAGENNNQEGNDDQQLRRIPFLFRFFIGPHIARYMRMRRAMREGRQNVVAPSVAAPANNGNDNTGQGPSEPGPSQPGPSDAGSSGQGPSSSRQQ
uniref:Serine/arginine repetitive matrix protein 1 n=1 Tax=Caenorhabditis tropicalis TaxID=1561998 RepID=A0A1I7UAE0_9PELO